MLNPQLKREEQGMLAAKAIGTPVVELLSPYTKTSSGRGVLHMERFEAAYGTTLMTPEFVADAEPGVGRDLAAAVLAVSGRPLSPEIDTSLLKRDDVRNASAATFWDTWRETSGVLLAVEHREALEESIGAKQLEDILADTARNLAPLIEAVYNPGIEFLAHNDASPSNTFVPVQGSDKPAMLINYEHAGATHNLALAKLTDMGTMYAQSWPNIEMQQEYLRSIYESMSDDPDEAYVICRGLVVTGTISLAQYWMSTEEPIEQMGRRALLGNLKDNLAVIEGLHRPSIAHG